MMVLGFMVLNATFNSYFGGGNRSARRKSLTYHKSLPYDTTAPESHGTGRLMAECFIEGLRVLVGL
jgi:hypothetical protein